MVTRMGSRLLSCRLLQVLRNLCGKEEGELSLKELHREAAETIDSLIIMK